jgi:hypothetical protein
MFPANLLASALPDTLFGPEFGIENILQFEVIQNQWICWILEQASSPQQSQGE